MRGVALVSAPRAPSGGCGGACGACSALAPSADAAYGSQPDQSDQVVRGRHQVAREVHPLQTAKARLAERAHRFHPAKDLFNAFPFSLTDRIARPTSGPPIDRAASSLARV